MSKTNAEEKVKADGQTNAEVPEVEAETDDCDFDYKNPRQLVTPPKNPEDPHVELNIPTEAPPNNSDKNSTQKVKGKRAHVGAHKKDQTD